MADRDTYLCEFLEGNRGVIDMKVAGKVIECVCARDRVRRAVGTAMVASLVSSK